MNGTKFRCNTCLYLYLQKLSTNYSVQHSFITDIKIIKNKKRLGSNINIKKYILLPHFEKFTNYKHFIKILTSTPQRGLISIKLKLYSLLRLLLYKTFDLQQYIKKFINELLNK